MLVNYKKCLYCGNTKFLKYKTQTSKFNFYIKAIISDLKISLKRIKVFECSRCFIIQNNPWFDKYTSKRIYSNIYGQHHRNWSNLLNYINFNKKPNHGQLFTILNKNLKITNYAEFNSPFMGLFLNFFDLEHRRKKKKIKILFNNIINYLTSRQLVGVSQKKLNSSNLKAAKFLKNINKFKNKNNVVKKYLFTENTNLSWSQNDNYKSVNSISFAREMFDFKEEDIISAKTSKKFDLFGIFHSLDHTFNPKKILDFALNNSKLVIVYCHIDKMLNKQHLFSFSEKFLDYLNSKKIYTLKINDLIDKNFSSPELYFVCSKDKKIFLNLKNAY